MDQCSTTNTRIRNNGTVRCFRIDGRQRTVREEFVPVQSLMERSQIKAMSFEDGSTISPRRSAAIRSESRYGEQPVMLVLHYNKADPENLGGCERHGFVFNTEHPDDDSEHPPEIWELESPGADVAGEALLVAYIDPLVMGRGNKKQKELFSEPVDVPWSREFVRSRIKIWTRGVLRRLPEITCMLAPRFDDPTQYELLLRVENADAMHLVYYWIYGDDFIEHVQHLSPQLVSLTLGKYDLRIVIGRIGSPKDQVRVSIYQLNHSRLPLVDSVAIAAEKIPRWIVSTLDRFFEEELVNKIIRKSQVEREERSVLESKTTVSREVR